MQTRVIHPDLCLYDLAHIQMAEFELAIRATQGLRDRLTTGETSIRFRTILTREQRSTAKVLRETTDRVLGDMHRIPLRESTSLGVRQAFAELMRDALIAGYPLGPHNTVVADDGIQLDYSDMTVHRGGARVSSLPTDAAVFSYMTEQLHPLVVVRAVRDDDGKVAGGKALFMWTTPHLPTRLPGLSVAIRDLVHLDGAVMRGEWEALLLAYVPVLSIPDCSVHLLLSRLLRARVVADVSDPIDEGRSAHVRRIIRRATLEDRVWSDTSALEESLSWMSV